MTATHHWSKHNKVMLASRATSASSRQQKRMASKEICFPSRAQPSLNMAMGQNLAGTFSVGSLTTSLKGFLRVTRGFPGFWPKAISSKHLRALRHPFLGDPSETKPWGGSTSGGWFALEAYFSKKERIFLSFRKATNNDHPKNKPKSLNKVPFISFAFDPAKNLVTSAVLLKLVIAIELFTWEKPVQVEVGAGKKQPKPTKRMENSWVFLKEHLQLRRLLWTLGKWHLPFAKSTFAFNLSPPKTFETLLPHRYPGLHCPNVWQHILYDVPFTEKQALFYLGFQLVGCCRCSVLHVPMLNKADLPTGRSHTFFNSKEKNGWLLVRST